VRPRLGFVHKIVLALTMSTALGFGFMHLFIPDFLLDFDRLHIFFFNLCAGGSLILYHAQGRNRVRVRVSCFFLLSFFYSLFAFFELYPLAIALSVPLVAIVESVRIKRFGFLPLDFLRNVPASDKFLQASLLCLSIGMALASLIIINNEMLGLFHLDKLTIDVFFLGYSFPLSLVTMSIMFSHMTKRDGAGYRLSQEISFWAITGGVVVFFLFIIFDLLIAEIIISNVLLIAVCFVYYLFVKNSVKSQERLILMSGMGFLVLTGVSGVYYLFDYLIPGSALFHDFFLTFHVTVSLYGWNLSGLFIIVRWNDFPVSRSASVIVALHWATVFVLAPLGKHYPPMALVALPAYVALLALVFFTDRRPPLAKESPS